MSSGDCCESLTAGHGLTQRLQTFYGISDLTTIGKFFESFDIGSRASPARLAWLSPQETNPREIRARRQNCWILFIILSCARCLKDPFQIDSKKHQENRKTFCNIFTLWGSQIPKVVYPPPMSREDIKRLTELSSCGG